jgi:hypothetical protein
MLYYFIFTPLHHRFNYASFDAGAKLLNSSEKSKGENNILTKDGDQYMKVSTRTLLTLFPF